MLQEYRPAGALMQNTIVSTRISPRWGSDAKKQLYLQEFRPAGALMQNTIVSTRISPRWRSKKEYIQFNKDITAVHVFISIYTQSKSPFRKMYAQEK